jgi:hypothetical protein
MIEGAKILYISKQNHYGRVKEGDTESDIHYVALVQYNDSSLVYMFLCDENKNVIHDEVFSSVQEAKLHIYTQITKECANN